jgi:hypothetical protein
MSFSAAVVRRKASKLTSCRWQYSYHHYDNTITGTIATTTMARFQQKRRLNSTMASGPAAVDTDQLKTNLEGLAPTIAESLVEKGYFTIADPTALFDDDIHTATFCLETLRAQAEALRQEGRYQQSWSESIVDGKATRFDKPGVFACEPDGADYDTAPDLVSYMATLITTLPPALNEHLSGLDVARISNEAFNAKLAVTCANSEYPLHVDNSLGVEGGDTRKLTCILYLNPEYAADQDNGELRLHLLEEEIVDVEPSPGRWLLFWTDEIPHKVLKTGETAIDRYALTVWFADEDPVSHIHNPRSKFADLRLQAFEKQIE